MKKSSISIENLKKAIETEYQPVTQVEWRGLAIPVKHHLSISEMMEFTNGVVNSCFVVNSGEYIPEVKDFATRCAILEFYAGIILPRDLEAKCDLVYSSDIISHIVQHVDGAQFNSMCAAIDKKIDNIAQSNIEALNKQMEEVVAGFKGLEEKLSGIFGGIDNDTISKVAGAIANGSFDENKLVEAFKKDAEHKDNVIQMPTVPTPPLGDE